MLYEVITAWNMDCERPKKVYKLTKQGENVLNYAENALIMIRQKLAPGTETGIIVADPITIK